MKIQLKSAEIRLDDNHPLSLRSARGLRIICTSGTLWITTTGESGDIFLAAGEAHRVHSNGLTIIESIGSGKLRLENTGIVAGFPQLIEWGKKCIRATWPAFSFGSRLPLRQRP